MAVSDILEHNKPVTVGLAVAVIVVAVWLIASRGGAGKPAVAKERFYFDVGSGQLFTGPITAHIPIKAPSGPNNGVMAHVFACGECSSDNRQTVYIETLSEQAVVSLASGNPDPTLMDTGRLVATPSAAGEEPKWVPAASGEGFKITGAVQTLCGGDSPTICVP